MTKRIFVAMLLLVGSVGAQTDTLRPTTSIGVGAGGNTYDNNLTTAGGVTSAGIIDDVNPMDYQRASGTVTGFSAPQHTYTSVVLKYKCDVSVYTGTNGSSGYGTITATWTGGGSGSFTCDGTQRSIPLPANVATASVTVTVDAYGQNDVGITADPGSCTTYLYEVWLDATYGVLQKRIRTTTTE